MKKIVHKFQSLIRVKPEITQSSKTLRGQVLKQHPESLHRIASTSVRNDIPRSLLQSKLTDMGYTLIEVLIVIVILSIIMAGLSRLMEINLVASRSNVRHREIMSDIAFAMTRIIDRTREAKKVFIPTNASPVRDILAITANIDNDQDGSIDEDEGSDLGNDNQPGLAGFDDDNDGMIDEGGSGQKWDDDEDGLKDEDVPDNGLDDDGDGRYDEELRANMTGGGCPPTCSYDDDGDGMTDEDPSDPLIFYLNNGTLYERKIVWDPYTGSSNIQEHVLATNVSQFRVERVTNSNGKTLIKIKIAITRNNSEVILNSQAYIRDLAAITP